ncbi:MAG: hypothetical protein JWP47_51 [Polaromonas sp.]|jgi:hypothetical protein|nr:hypothetical protein [Polaromonas sp.]
MQRRSLFKLGLASAAVLAVAGGASAWWKPGFDGKVLTPSGREIFTAVGVAVLDKTLPASGAERLAAIAALLHRVEVLVIALPPHAQSELSQLLSLLASPPGRLALAGLSQAWTAASIEEVQIALGSMRLSRSVLRQQAYAALHEISVGAYFSDPSSWTVLGYPGPVKI